MSNRSLNIPWNTTKILPWIILFVSCINMIFLGGTRRAFGSYIAVLRTEFINVTLVEVNWIGDSYAAVGCLTTSLSTAIIIYFSRRYGFFQLIGALFILLSYVTSSFVPNPHWLFLTHSFINGIGSSLIISTVSLVVNEYFDLKHPYHILATTLISGGSVASIIFVPFVAYIIQQYNWRMSFLIMGGLYFVGHFSAVFFFRKNDEYKEINYQNIINCSSEGISRMQVPLLMLWFIERVMTTMVTYGLLMNLTDYVHRTHPNLVRSTTLTTLFSAGEASAFIVGTIITCATTNFFHNKLKYVLLITSILMSASLIVLEFTVHVQSARRILIFIAGFALGPSVFFIYPAGEEITRLPSYIAFPFTLIGVGLGIILSPLLSAKIAELFKYKWFFLVQGCLIFVKVLCLLAITLILLCCKEFTKEDKYLELIPNTDEFAIDKDISDERQSLLQEDPKK